MTVLWAAVVLSIGQVDGGWPDGPRVRQDGLLDPGVIANPPLQAGPDDDEGPLVASSRGKRVLFSVLFGTLAGAGGALVGGLVGETLEPGAQRVQRGVWLGGAVGWSLGLPFGVLASGAAFRGTGGVFPMLLGELLGALLGAATVALAGGFEALPILGVATLAGAIVGYEVSSAPARTASD